MLAITILHHTPPYVFLLFAYLMWQGFQAWRPRTRPLWQILIAPMLFVISSLILISGRVNDASSLLIWVVALVVVLPIGFKLSPHALAVEAGRHRLTLTGSPIPLIRNAVLFSVHYGIGVSDAMHLFSPHGIGMARVLVSGASLGYCAGWVAAVVLAYRAHLSEA